MDLQADKGGMSLGECPLLHDPDPGSWKAGAWMAGL